MFACKTQVLLLKTENILTQLHCFHKKGRLKFSDGLRINKRC
ncbi:hypothetical protein l11_22060 [Neisseria weaveri LMG 5135]|nr:hypothetical protein l11_22060 [Neisseria weaveri LMG 5135]EGV37961.1 hypothetical protein l13_02110 [Neisseria weaveri ATCC 51223]